MESNISWAEDYRTRVNPNILTKLLHEAVPVLRHINWTVVETAEGYAKTVLPLNYEATNQHGTHQAALIAIAADYTGGIAIATLLRGVPVIGVHPQTTDNGAALWLVSIDIKYRLPSAGDLTVSAKIPEECFETVRRRYNSGQQIIESVEIHFESEGDQVATASFKYFLRQSKYLKPESPTSKINALFKHRVKASARLIAGLRATENSSSNPLYFDQYSAEAARTHGKLLAERFTSVLPQLRDMVAARTKNIDDLLTLLTESDVRQIVFVGVGFDFRLFRVLKNRRDVKVFELDLPHMLVEREKIISTIEELPNVARETVGINLELEDIAEVMLVSNFDPSTPSLFIIEGTSMYLDESINMKILLSIHRLMQNPNSMLWIDIVAKSVVERKSNLKEVQKFLDGMEKLGEPFVFGLDKPKKFFAELGYSVYKKVPSSFYKVDNSDPIFSLYNFYILQQTSQPGFTAVPFGANSDVPIPSVYLP